MTDQAVMEMEWTCAALRRDADAARRLFAGSGTAYADLQARVAAKPPDSRGRAIGEWLLEAVFSVAELPVALVPAECRGCGQPAHIPCGGCIPVTGRRRRCAQQCTCG